MTITIPLVNPKTGAKSKVTVKDPPVVVKGVQHRTPLFTSVPWKTNYWEFDSSQQSFLETSH